MNLGKWPFLPAAKLSRADVKDKPLAAPNVEQATPSGTIHAKSLKTFAPNVVATALGLRKLNSGYKKACITSKQAVHWLSLQ